jgi:hypothetical protein
VWLRSAKSEDRYKKILELYSILGPDLGKGLASRNVPLAFAYRTGKNLWYIESSSTEGADVHVVTQLVLSLLGLIVFPWAILENSKNKVKSLLLADLVKEGWPEWESQGNACKGLGQLLRRVRNAAAHRGVFFTSDSLLLEEVVITFSDEEADWRATIRADHLRDFCLRFIDLMEKISL